MVPLGDVHPHRGEITVRDGKGRKDWIMVLPASLVDPVATQIARVGSLHQRDLASGAGIVVLPDARRP